jgi:ATP-dependent 26S proteasome regulatory subunit
MIDAIDLALYRSGQLNLFIEVALPNAKGRSDIFDIHTKTLSKNSLLADDVNIERLIHQTRGINGAYIEKLVRRALHSAMKRDVQLRGTLDISDEDAEQLQVKNIDFTVALTQLQRKVEQHTAF